MEKANAVVKVDTEENWSKAKNYIPDSFTIICALPGGIGQNFNSTRVELFENKRRNARIVPSSYPKMR